MKMHMIAACSFCELHYVNLLTPKDLGESLADKELQVPEFSRFSMGQLVKARRMPIQHDNKPTLD
jgi:hypothetical protein